MNSYASFWIRTGTADSHIRLALDAVVENRQADAATHYSEAVRLSPGDLRIPTLMVRELMTLGRTEEAKEIAAQVNKDFLKNERNHFLAAELLGANGEWNAAVSEARRGIESAPDNPGGYGNICEWLCRSGEFAAAAAAGREAERTDPFNPNLHFNMGIALSRLGNNTNAADHFELAMRLKPEWFEAHDQLGLCLLALKRCDEATNQFFQALQIAPENVVARFHLGLAFGCLREPRREMDQYGQILKRQAGFTPALNALAWMLATNPDPDLRDGAEAVRLASEACRLTGNKSAEFLGTLSAAYARAERFDEAIATAEQAVKLAESTGQSDIAASNRKALEIYRGHKPYTTEAQPSGVR